MDRLPLTAELIARAIVESAKAFGDNPIAAVNAKAGRIRRCMGPAAVAVAEVTGQPWDRVIRVMGVSRAAFDAIRYNVRPEADAAVLRATRALKAMQPARPRVILPEGCRWPLGDPKSADFHFCDAVVVKGRQYCGEHCRAAGMPDTPRATASAGRVAAPYSGRL